MSDIGDSTETRIVKGVSIFHEDGLTLTPAELKVSLLKHFSSSKLCKSKLIGGIGIVLAGTFSIISSQNFRIIFGVDTAFIPWIVSIFGILYLFYVICKNKNVNSPEQCITEVITEMQDQYNASKRQSRIVEIERLETDIVPRIQIPDIELVQVSLDITHDQRIKEITANCQVYISTYGNVKFTVPYHKSEILLHEVGTDNNFEIPIVAERSRIALLSRRTTGSLITHTESEVIINGSGTCHLLGKLGRISKSLLSDLHNKDLELSITMYFTENSQTKTESIILKPTGLSNANQAQWHS